MSTIELIRELILVVSAIIFVVGAAQFLQDNWAAGCILVGYGCLPFAVDCIVNKLYVYFLVWIAVCFIAFRLLSDVLEIADNKYERELDNILNDE